MSESEMGNRGSKSVIHSTKQSSIIVKEQRVNGSCIRYINRKYNLMLKCTLVGFERSYQGRVLSNQIDKYIRRLYTTDTKFKQFETDGNSMNP